MKAIVLENAGGIENLNLKEISKPNLQAGEVLVKVRTLGINPVDIKTRNGKALYNSLKDKPPVILGWDIAGEVVDVYDGNEKFNKGDEVFGMVNFPGHGSAYSELVAAPAAHLALKPTFLSFEDAAASCLATLTAWQVLVHQARIKKNDRVLIHAAAGGVGHFAVQIAKYFGAVVVGTSSPSNHSFLKTLGVDEILDYHTADAFKKLAPVDIILDPMGGDTTKLSYSLLKDGGRLISIVGGVKEEDASLIHAKNTQVSNYLVHSSGEDMDAIANLLLEGHLKPHVSHVFPFNKIAEAHRQIETGKTKGKVVVNVK